jgi:hypothetical protein
VPVAVGPCIALQGPVQADNSAKSGFAQDTFTIDWDRQQDTYQCPHTITKWGEWFTQ